MSIRLDQLRPIDRADVYKGGRLAAGLRRFTDSVHFEYDPEYLQNPDARPIATTLPLTAEAVRTHAGGAIPPFFAGLLPEGRRLSALRRAVKTSADDDFTLLLAVGGDAIGDVQVVPRGEVPSEIEPTVDADSWEEVRFAELYSASVGGVVERVAIPGVQEKVSARMVNLPVARRGERYILKLNPPEFPHLVENEHFFLGAAARTGLAVAESEVVVDRDGADALLVKRFDRSGSSGGIPQLHAQEDACQTLGLYPADKYRVSSEAVLTRLAALCRATPVAARELLRQMAFAYVSCNGDAHAKNFSIVRGEGDEWRVTPAYDVPSSYPYGDHTMALSINGKSREDIGRADFVALGRAAGLGGRVVTKTLDSVAARVELWIDELDGLPFDSRLIRKWRRAIEYRRERMT